MTTAIATIGNNDSALVPSDVTPIDLQTALAGDLSRLTPDGRLKFYGAICNTTGLNPLTKPFDWLTLNGKLILYANKGCAEQLRKIHGVSTDILERKVEHGVLIVRVKATAKDGRYDEAIGAVPFADSFAPDVKANAMMKAETKAKRRVTLSLCGLGLLDESEMDTVRETHAPIVSAMNGEESASARAEKLNQALTAGEKSDVIDIVPEPAKEEVKQPPAAEAPTPAPQPENLQDDFPSTPPRELSEEEKFLRDLETVLTENKQSIPYIISQGRLKQDDGLEKLDKVYAKKIISNPKGFHRAVETWAKAAK